MGTFLTCLLSDLMVQHSPDAVVIECDRATMQSRCLRKRTRPSSSTSPCYGRSVLSSAINVRSQSLVDDSINKTKKHELPCINRLPTISPRSDRWCPSRAPTLVRHDSESDLTCPKKGVRNGVSRSSTMSPRSAPWCPSRRPSLSRCDSESVLTCPSRRPSLSRHDSESVLTCPKRVLNDRSSTSTMSPRSDRWCPSRRRPTLVRHGSESVLTCPKRRESLRSAADVGDF